MSSVPGELDLHLEIHSEGTGDPATYDGAWLAADSSYATIENGRGTVRLDLASGGQCGVDTLAFDGTTASGTGTWVASGTESYRDATGSGTFTFVASVGPGADNPFQLGLNGSSSVPDPSLSVEVVEAVREHGSESGSRHALVTFAVTNTGPGDAFGVGLLETTSSALNITPVSPVPDDLGDLLAGDTALVQVRYRFDRPACKTGERGCEFDSTLEVEMPDALDNAANFSSTVPVRIPTHSQG